MLLFQIQEANGSILGALIFINFYLLITIRYIQMTT